MRLDRKSRKRPPRRASANQSFWWVLLGGLGVLVAFLFLVYGRHPERLRRLQEEKIQADMDRICVAAVLFYQEHGRYPDQEEGIEALRTGMPGDLPMDPWRNPYIYQAPEHTHLPVLISFGADGRSGGKGVDADVAREGCKSTAWAPE